MRAIYFDGDFSNSKTISLTKDKSHHLLNVVRLKEGEEILLLDGKGKTAKAKFIKLSKKLASIEVQEVSMASPTSQIDLALGLTKKDAFSKVIKSSVELGIKKFHPYKCEYSQSYELNHERQMNLIESACEQSNNPFFLKLEKLIHFNDLTKKINQYNYVFVFTPNKKQ